MKHIDESLDRHDGQPMPSTAADGLNRAVCKVCRGVLRATWVQGKLVVHDDRVRLR